jgi:hypothetical protein
MFQFYDQVENIDKERLISGLQQLGHECGGEAAGIMGWHVIPNLDIRKGYTIIELGFFSDLAALGRFRAHPCHSAMTEEIRESADWIVGDLEMPRWISESAKI